jgi:type II secretory pathway pseudopilin PulG
MKSQIHKKPRLNSRSFTILEIIVVIVIIGALAGIALVRYGMVQRNIQDQEGASILMQIYGAQKRYYLEHGAYADSLGVLDIEVREPKYFRGDTIRVIPGTSDRLASIDSNDGLYFLDVTIEGTIRCLGSFEFCQKLGYPR